MPEYKNDNNGAAWTNDYATPDNKQPQFRGKGNFANQDFDISVWIKAKDGKKFLTFEFKEPYVKDTEERGDDSSKHEVVLDDDQPINLDDIPF